MRKYRKQLLDSGLDSLKTPSKKVVHKAGEFLENKIVDGVTKSYNDSTEKQETVEEINIPPEKRRLNIKQTEKSIIKME